MLLGFVNIFVVDRKEPWEDECTLDGKVTNSSVVFGTLAVVVLPAVVDGSVDRPAVVGRPIVVAGGVFERIVVAGRDVGRIVVAGGVVEKIVVAGWVVGRIVVVGRVVGKIVVATWVVGRIVVVGWVAGRIVVASWVV